MAELLSKENDNHQGLDSPPRPRKNSVKLDFPAYRAGISTQLISPHYSDVLKYLVRIRTNLHGLLGAEVKATGDKHGSAVWGDEVTSVLAQTIDDVDVSLTQLFQTKEMEIPTAAAEQSLDSHLRAELQKAETVDGVWAETVHFIRDNYSKSRSCDKGESRVSMSLEERKCRQSHFTTQWISGNMCNIVTRFSPDRLNGDKMREVLSRVGQWGMDVFELDRVSNQRPLVCVAYATFCQHDLFKTFHIPTEVFVHFFIEVERSYHRGNSFHNNVHAADVMQTVNVLLSAERLQTMFTDLETMTLLFSAALLDVDHPGVSNLYLVNAQSPLAAAYNDQSVLEHHHVTKAFEILQRPGCDIFQNMSQRQRYLVGKYTKKIILSTDMACHTSMLATLATKLDKFRRTADLSSEDRVDILAVMCHAADLSYPTKPVHIYNEWVDRHMTELFRQGDLERHRGQKISFLCDRHSDNCKNIPKTQIGFIDFVVGPLFDAWGKFVEPDGKMFLSHLEENRAFYNSGSIEHDQFRSAKGLPEKVDKISWFSQKTEMTSDWTYKSMVRSFFNEYPIQYVWGEVRRMSPNMKLFAIAWLVGMVGVTLVVMARTKETVRCLFPEAYAENKWSRW